MHGQINHRGIWRLLQQGLLLLLALFSLNAHALIAVDNVSTTVDNNPSTLTLSHATGAGSNRLMIVGVSLLNQDLETVSSVTYNGTALNFIGQVSRNNDSRVELWSYLNPPATTANVVVNFNEQVQGGAVLGVITFTGIDQATPYGPFQSNSGNSNTASASVSSAGGELVLGVLAARRQDNNPTVAGGTAQWTLKSQPGNNRTAGAGATFTGAASINLTWNLNEPDDWAIGAISLRDAAIPITTIPGFCDDFESGLGNWVVNASAAGGAGTSSATFNSGANSLFTRGGPVNVSSSAAIDATGKPFQFRLWIRRGADSFSEDPDNNEDLRIQYLNNLNTWVTLETFAGNGTPGQIYERNYALPVAAQHANLRVRVAQANGSGANFDFWHVDDVCVLEVVQPQVEYRMDEPQWNGSANEVVDSSGNGNDANANAASGLTTVDPGQICRAGEFDGADDYIEAPGIDAYLRATASLSFWIRTTQTGNDTGWLAPGVAGVEQAGGADDIFWGWLDASGRIGISVGNNYGTKSTVAINDGNYHHVVLTRDAGSGAWKIYIDGVLDVSGTSTAGVIGNGFGSIGRIEDTGGTPAYLQGDLDELLVFNSVLSDGAVSSIYTNQSNGRNLDGNRRNCPGSLAYFQLDEAAGVWNGTPGEIVDQSGNFNSAAALGTGAGVDSVPAQVCRGIDIPLNTSNALQYGFDSGIDVDGDIGNRGSINFWYRSDNAWVGGGDRMLFDASPNDLPGADKYFFLVLRNNGRLFFGLEDSSDGDFTFQTGVNAIAAGVWTHIAVTWDMSGSRQVFVNGALAGSNSAGTNGQIGALRTLYFGDNRSTYHPGGSANSANGVIDEVRVYARVQTQAEIVADQNATHGCGSTLDHFVVTPATTSASTCLPNAITIVAEDASNNALTTYAGTVNITTSTNNGNWSVNSANNTTSPNPDNDDDGAVSYGFLLSDAGDIILDLSNTHAEVLTITVTDPAATVSTTSVAITYSSNVFVITEDPIQVAGRPLAMNVAMWTDDLAGSGSCGIDTNYNYPAIVLDASIDRGGVLPGANDPAIGAVTIPDGPASAAVTLDFSATPGQVSFNLGSSDVGQYRLTLADNTNTHSSSSIIGTSARLTLRPFGIAVTAIEDTATSNPNPGNATSGLPIFSAAGNDLGATVSGVLWDAADDTEGGLGDGVIDAGRLYNDNVVAPSYTWDTALLVAPAGFTPATGTPGAITNGLVTQVEFSGGSAVINDWQYDEVGSFTLQSRATAYLGLAGADVSGDDIIVGRFIPASFRITNKSGGSFQDSCNNIFTYIGEAFGYSTAPTFDVTALNAQNLATGNYRDGYAKLDGNSITVNVTQDDGNLLAVSYIQAAMIAVAANDNSGNVGLTFGGDSYRYGPTVPLTFAKFPNSQLAPFTADINPEITQVSDGEVTTALSETLDPTATASGMRFGRLRLENAHGSELDPLAMPAFTEYWTGTGWTRSIEDSCTSIADADLVSVASPPGLSTPTVRFKPFASAGDVILDYPAPGSGNDGFVDTTVDLDAAAHLWLRWDWDADGVFDNDPFARATFGIFEGDEVQIYIQQVYE